MITPDLTRLSPNFYDPPVVGSTVVIHSTRSGTSMNPSEFAGTLNYFATRGNPSSHWVISRQGHAARVVADTRQAWHAGVDNDNTWGIELEQGVETDGFTAPQIDRLIDVCRGYVDDFGVRPVRVFTSFASGFVGHQDTVQGKSFGKSDPGRLFPWDDFISRLTPLPPPQGQPLRALVAAAFIESIGKPITDLGPEDAAAFKAHAAKLG